MKEQQIDKMTFKEFIVISKWTFELLFKISKSVIFLLIFSRIFGTKYYNFEYE